MSVQAINPDSATKLRAVLKGSSASMVETMSSLLGVSMEISNTQLVCVERDDILNAIDAECTVIRGALDKDFAGRRLRVLMTSTDSMTMAAIMVTTPEETIHERRESGIIEDADFEAFGELANIACSGIDEQLREQIGSKVGIRLEDTGRVTPGSDPDGMFDDGDYVALQFQLEIEEYPPSVAFMLVDRETAEAWNGGPLEFGEAAPDSPQSAGFGDLVEPEVEHRGTMACYLADPEPYHLVRRAGRRAGLDLDNRPVSEVPNPASYRDKLVLIDVPLRNERRFHWCKRLKEYEPSCRVVLMVRHPSRQRIVLGFLSKADIIVGWPLSEDDLVEKLNSLYEQVDAEPTTEE
ncbi:MAG: hypothetical protein KDB80_12615 [Planctomycetes bacterium]|nr:hypothetical protein [Planctomycetota bacterium]